MLFYYIKYFFFSYNFIEILFIIVIYIYKFNKMYFDIFIFKIINYWDNLIIINFFLNNYVYFNFKIY